MFIHTNVSVYTCTWLYDDYDDDDDDDEDRIGSSALVQAKRREIWNDFYCNCMK